MDFLSKQNEDDSQILQGKNGGKKKGKILSSEKKENGAEEKGFSDKIKGLIKKIYTGNADSKGEEKNSRGGDVNFVASDFIIPPEKEVKRKIIILIIFIFIVILAIISIYAALSIKEKISLESFASLAEEKNNIQKEIDFFADARKDSEKLEQDIALANMLLDQHIYWDNFLNLIESYTRADVFYKSFNGDITGQLKLDIVANDFNALTEQIRVFEEAENFSSVEVSSIALEKDDKTGKIKGVKCFISMNVTPEIFYKK